MSGRLSITRDSRGLIHIEIKDEASHLMIVDAYMEPDDFAKCVTGLSEQFIDIHRGPNEYTTARYGKTLETKRVLLPGIRFSQFGSDIARHKLFEAIDEHLIDGWELHSDGLRSQQNDTSGHAIVLKRFVSEDGS